MASPLTNPPQKRVDRAARLEQLGMASAGVIHDLNNQLMLIMNHLEAGDIDRARRAARTCATLTGDLLDFCRDSSPRLRAVNLSRFVLVSVPGLNISPSIQLRLELDSESSPVLADYSGLTRILHNLISNASAAMEGSGTITITVGDSELRVSDTGCGIPASAQRRIFQPFFSTRTERTADGGTGLGLAIVREIMRQHGGSVHVESAPGEGATFRLLFRRAPQPKESSAGEMKR